LKIALAVGTRPEIVKMAPVLRACRARRVPFTLLHTGQHYSFELNELLFRELELPEPDHNLRVGSGSHAFQTGAILQGLEPILARERPDVLLVEGDTNSVLAAALAASHARTPVGHIEAGLRSGDRRMQEERNRVLVDHLADFLFAPTADARDNLLREGIGAERIAVTGNTVVDELLRQRPRALRAAPLEGFGVEAGGFALATVHRPENVDDPARLRGIFEGLKEAGNALRMPVLMPLHPRTASKLGEINISLGSSLRELPPLGYLEFLSLEAGAALILTDSGGVQEEACCLGVPCVTLRDTTERPESIAVAANVLTPCEPERIVESALRMSARHGGWRNPFGDGRSGLRIIDGLARKLRRPRGAKGARAAPTRS
jgi:UDP-N-acetylglucosamine 2-epimerase (non-hydrolysing)